MVVFFIKYLQLSWICDEGKYHEDGTNSTSKLKHCQFGHTGNKDRAKRAHQTGNGPVATPERTTDMSWNIKNRLCISGWCCVYRTLPNESWVNPVFDKEQQNRFWGGDCPNELFLKMWWTFMERCNFTWDYRAEHWVEREVMSALQWYIINKSILGRKKRRIALNSLWLSKSIGGYSNRVERLEFSWEYNVVFAMDWN